MLYSGHWKPRRIGYAILAMVLLSLVACGGKPRKAPAPETVLDLRIIEADANKGPYGQSLPISLRIFELAALGKFEQADFFGLYEDAEGLLGGDLVGSERVALAPRASEHLTWVVDPRVRHLGLLAGYRTIDGVRWRAAVPIRANQTNAIFVEVGSSGISAHARHGISR
jgi:type VI secretion system protein VasD